MTAANRQVRLAARPSGLPEPSDWELTEAPVPEPGTMVLWPLAVPLA